MPEIIFNGPEGRLEGRYHPGRIEGAPIVLVLHPNPTHPNGTMNNKVTYTLYQTFVQLGFSVMRFNFRGVGRSQGTFDGGAGELGDAAAALDWLQLMNKDAKICWVAGYSFGSWIGMQLLMRRPEIGGFVAVSPPASSKDFSFLAPCPSSGLIIQGDKDALVPEPSVAALAERLAAQRGISVDYELIRDADHDFSNRLKEIQQAVVKYVEKARKNIKTRKSGKSKSVLKNKVKKTSPPK